MLNLATNFKNCSLDAPNYVLVYVLKEQSIEGYIKKYIYECERFEGIATKSKYLHTPGYFVLSHGAQSDHN